MTISMTLMNARRQIFSVREGRKVIEGARGLRYLPKRCQGMSVRILISCGSMLIAEEEEELEEEVRDGMYEEDVEDEEVEDDDEDEDVDEDEEEEDKEEEEGKEEECKNEDEGGCKDEGVRVGKTRVEEEDGDEIEEKSELESSDGRREG
jgi:DNA-directed RNA polymerase subunit M/transcription elongation factor TFIIS